MNALIRHTVEAFGQLNCSLDRTESCSLKLAIIFLIFIAIFFKSIEPFLDKILWFLELFMIICKNFKEIFIVVRNYW